MHNAIVATAVLGVMAAGCGGDEPTSAEPAQRDRATTARVEEPKVRADAKTAGGKQTAPDAEPSAACPPGVQNCRTATGRVVYVEAVDPDGDGDAHLVLASAEGITAPGISVIDVPAALRPDPLPGIGDRVSAAGPVHRGSYGQRQIQASSIAVGTGR